jgi:HNH endonuclease
MMHKNSFSLVYTSFMSLINRISQKIRKSSECWDWTGYVAKDGYGSVWLKGKPVQAHIAVYSLLIGEVPAGLQLDHLCRNRGCVNPKHLEPVSKKENQRRRIDLRLSLDAVKEIKDMYSLGHTQQNIATLYGVSQSAVSRVISGEIWA